MKNKYINKQSFLISYNYILKRIVFFLILQLFSANFCKIFSNDYKNIDSVYKKYKLNTSEDSIRLKIELAQYYYIRSNSDSAYYYIIQSYKDSKRINNQDLMTESLFMLSEINSFYNPQEMPDNLKMLREISHYQADNLSKAIQEYIIGNYYFMKDSSKAIFNLIKAENLIKSKEHGFYLAIIRQKIGDSYLYLLNNLNEAAKYFYSAKRIYDSLNLENKTNLYLKYCHSELLNSMGILFKKKNNYDEALKYYNEYYQKSEEIGNIWGIGIALNNRGIILDRKGQHSDAEKEYYKALNIIKVIKESESVIGGIFHNLGNLYSSRKKYKTADSLLNLSMINYAKAGNLYGYIRVKASVAENLTYQNKYNKAKAILNEIITNQGKINDTEVIINSYKLLSEINEHLGNFSQSFNYFKKYSQLKDSISLINNSEEIGQLKAAYEIQAKIDKEKRQMEEAERIETEKIQKRNLLEYTGILIFFITLFSVIFIFGRFNIGARRIESMIFVAFLLLYEFILIYFENDLSNITNGEPLISLILFAGLALAFTPLDTWLETKLRHMVLKKKISE